MTTNYIYTLRDPAIGLVRYVGKAKDLKKRAFKHHESPNKHLVNWIRKLERLGVKPKMEVIETCGDNWPEREMAWIKDLKDLGCDLINMRAGGEGPMGHWKMGDETKKKISEANKGRVRSEETKRKLSEINKGKYLGRKMKPEWVAKLVASRKAGKGWGWSKETRRKIVLASKNQIHERGELSKNNKLTEDQVISILIQSAYGVPQVKLCKEFKVCPATVCHIIKGKIWNIFN